MMIVAALFFASPCAMALSCEELRSTVEGKIRANGATTFTVSIVGAGTSGKGQVVGTCDLGSKELIYTRSSANSATASSAAAPKRPASAARLPVITECADGRVITSGSCSK